MNRIHTEQGGRFSAALDRWHEFVATQDAAILDELLAENVRFHSPFVWKPKEGKPAARQILLTAARVFEEFCYVREILDGQNWALEFEARLGEYSMRGVDLIGLDERGKIVEFEVMIRPANALQAVGLEMGRRLAAGK